MMKRLTAITLLALLLVALPTTAFARGRDNCCTKTRAFAVCTVEDCDATGNHKHKGITYACHYYGDGHDYCNENYKNSGHHGRK